MSKRKRSSPKKNFNNENFEWISNREHELSAVSGLNKNVISGQRYIVKPRPPKDESLIHIGNLTIGLCHTSTIEVLEDTDSDEIVYIVHDNELKQVKLLIDKQLLTDIIDYKKIFYDVDICDKMYFVVIKVYVTLLPEEKLNARYAKILRKLLSHIYQRTFDYDYENREFQKRHNLDELYNAVASLRTDIDVKFDTSTDSPQLLPRLRPYQLKAVQWMLDREKITENCENIPHPVYEQIVLPNKDTLYYNHINGYLTKILPVTKTLPSGGILADEMGLGKTLEVLACVLLNPHLKYKFKIDCDTDDDLNQEYEYPKHSLKKRKRLTVKKDGVSVKRNKSSKYCTEENSVQCLCGKLKLRGDEIKCINCDKIQHLFCVGLNEEINDYYCPQCYINRPLTPTKATLIISPKSISRQWLSEIKKHTKKNSLKVFVYRGISKDGYIYPTQLIDYDIVLTTYSVLQAEIKFSDDKSSDRSLRHVKKYYSPVTPLIMIEWWRVCLDEAQMVDSAISMVANMARLIPAIHRWAVSGTPAERGINDFYGLISFLGIEPYCDFTVWTKLLYYPYCYGDKIPLQKFLGKILWRTAKNDVLAEINIPKQTEKIYWLKLTPIENFFYRKEHEMCLSALQKRLQNFSSLDIKLESLDRQVLNKVLMPLLALRHACIHPHAVKGRYLTSKRNVTSMEDLLEALIDKNLNECEESLRVNIAVLNGLAGIHMLRNELAEAAQCYRDVLVLIEQHKDRLKIDILPRLHTLHNLADLMELNGPNVNIPQTLRDHLLREEATVFEEQYLQRKRAFVLTAEEDYKKLTDEANSIEQKFSFNLGAWMSELIDWIDVSNLTEDMIDRIQVTLLDNPVNNTVSIADSLTSSWTVIYQMSIWFDKISSNLGKLKKTFKNLKELSISEHNRFPESCVQDVINCHLRPMRDNNKKKKLCYFCKIEEEMKQYECHLFQISTKKSKTKRVIKDDEDEANKKTQGTWQRTQQEIIMKVLIQYGKLKNAPENLIKEGETHVEMYEILKKQFKEMRRLWTYYSEQIAAQDELNMSKERFRLKFPNEELPNSERKLVSLKQLDYSIENKLDTINILEPHMVDITFDLLSADKEREKADFGRKLGTLNYLETLRKRRYAGQKPDPCPICTNQLKEHWSIFMCGHSFCLDCLHHLLEQSPNAKSISCSVCRQVQSYQDVSYVKLTDDSTSDSSETAIKGSFSTKIEAIIRCVLQLIKNDPDVKILVFSAWKQVLQFIGESFSINNISYCHFTNSNHDKLVDFQDLTKKVTALLLPISAGAKGLNLIEATHVLLVEPLMNPGEEMQAIGRVHRIGQTKPTTVHRFLVCNSIEESIYKSVSSKSDKWKNDTITLRSLQELFQQSTQSLAEPV